MSAPRVARSALFILLVALGLFTALAGCRITGNDSGDGAGANVLPTGVLTGKNFASGRERCDCCASG